jgi:two-component system invasion response regulator UvrY
VIGESAIDNDVLPHRLRVLLVDDHAVVRAGYRRLLEQKGQIDVAGEAGDADGAELQFRTQRPDVVLLDLSMPGAGGFEIIKRLFGIAPEARILVVSMYDDAVLAERAIRLGALGYVTKATVADVLEAAISQIAAGKLYLSADIATAIASIKLTGGDNPAQILSNRELEIFELIVSGKQTQDIAEELNLSVKTVSNYHTVIKSKVGASTDVELVLLARRHRLSRTN